MLGIIQLIILLYTVTHLFSILSQYHQNRPQNLFWLVKINMVNMKVGITTIKEISVNNLCLYLIRTTNHFHHRHGIFIQVLLNQFKSKY
jgi:hypothetical protein